MILSEWFNVLPVVNGYAVRPFAHWGRTAGMPIRCVTPIIITGGADRVLV
jgi:hypothetical protein